MTVYNTLFMLLIFSFAISSMAMWVNWYLNPHESAVRYWAVALTMILAGCSLLAVARTQLPDTESMVPLGLYQLLRDLAKSLNGLAWIVLWVGILKFMGRPVPSRALLVCTWLAFLSLLLIAHPLGIPGAWAVAWISTIVTVFSLMILYEILRPGMGGAATWFASAGFLLAAATWGGRAVMSFVDLSRSVDSDFDSGVIFGAIISAYACMLSMILLTNQRLIDRIDDLSSRDPLTSVLNRQTFFECIEPLLKQAKDNRENCAFVLLNVDNFKDINKDFGEQLGDAALRQLAFLSMQTLGRNDLFARCEADEFVFFLYGKDAEQAQAEMNNLQVLLQRNLVESRQEAFCIYASMGIAEWQQDQSIQDIIQQTASALYEAKTAGGSQIVVFSQGETESPGENAAALTG